MFMDPGLFFFPGDVCAFPFSDGEAVRVQV